MIADVIVAQFLEFGTAAPSPMRHDRWLTHIGYVPSETPLPEHLATYTDQTTPATAISTEVSETSAPGNTEQPAHIENLVEALTFAQIVAQVMPVHEDLDRRAARALRKRAAGQQPRKLSQK